MDIKEITQIAKDQLLENKAYSPTFFVERSGNRIDVVILADFADTTHDKELQCFNAARQVARKGHWKVEEVTEIIFIVEAWVSSYKIGEPHRAARPSEDPNRKEVLLVSKLALMPQPQGKRKLSTTAQTIEMLRDGKGNLVDLLADVEEVPCEHALLKRFLSGIVSQALTSEDLLDALNSLQRDKRDKQ